MRPLIVVCALALASIAAAQEPSFEALGQAPVVGGDRVRARDRALEEAMKQAVEQATATVLDPTALVARSSDLRLRIYPKARGYVDNYRVLDESTTGGMFQMHISAQVATGRLARDLATPVPASTPRAAARLRAVICVNATAPLPTATAALRELVTARGVELLAPPPSCTAEVAARAAQAGGGQGALIATVELAPGVAIRGTERLSAHAKATVQLVESDGRVSGESKAERDAYEPSLEHALDAAARAAIVEAARELQGALATKWSNEAAPSGGVAVHLGGVGRYADYVAVVRALAALPGVAAVEPRRFGKAEVDLVVRTASTAPQLAAALDHMPPASVKVSASADGAGGLRLQVAAAPEGT